jgi:hypothetical protein
MTLKIFWTIFLKIFGLYLIWQILIALPSLFSSIIVTGSQDKGSLFSVISASIFLALFFIAIVRYCLFQTERVIEKLHLDKGFTEEKIEVNIHRSSLLTIIIVILGGLMLADALPLLVYDLFLYFQHAEAYKGFTDNRESPYLVTNLLKVVIGYFMATESRLLVNFIERKRRKANLDNDGPIEIE